jgi:hypothetical protein
MLKVVIQPALVKVLGWEVTLKTHLLLLIRTKSFFDYNLKMVVNIAIFWDTEPYSP